MLVSLLAPCRAGLIMCASEEGLRLVMIGNSIPKPPPDKRPVSNEHASSITIRPGTRLWLTIVDTTRNYAKNEEIEQVTLWVEVISSDPKQGIVVNQLVNPSDPHQPYFRASATGTGTVDAFQNIKIKAEYANDVLGDIQGTTPHHIPRPPFPGDPPPDATKR
jgi:hypothetical protein